jgi:hypothetical protein
MNLAEQRSFVQSLVTKPYDQYTLLAVYEALGKDPSAYAALLVAAAESTDQHAAASHWLTEAARVKMQALRDDMGGVKLLEAALERDPLNLRAAEHLVDLYRSHKDDAELESVLRARAATLHDRYVREPVELPRAAVAFEKLSGVYEAIGDASAAIAALRTALEIERARVRQTTPSPPPDPRAESVLRSVGVDTRRPAPSPGAVWTPPPERESRDTLPSPLPVAVREPSRTKPPESGPSGSPSRRAPGDPLLAVIEALHALRRCEGVVEGAALVLRTAMEAIPAATGLVHVSDVATRDYVVVAASGEHNARMVGSRTTEGDPVLIRAFEAMQAVAFDAEGSPALVGSRFRAINPERCVLCAPVQLDGQNFGAIELFDPDEQAGFSDGDRYAMTYVGERFAEFLADRSMVL